MIDRGQQISADLYDSLTALELLFHRNFYSPQGSYGNSKVSQILFTFELDRRLSEENANVSVVAFDPGVVDTGLYDRGLSLLRVGQHDC